MRAYETMIIFDTSLDDTAVQGLLARVSELVQAGNGKVVATDKWGRRRLAFEINKRVEGYYVVLQIVTEATNLNDMDRMLRIADGVVRHKTLRLPDAEAVRRKLFGEPAAAAQA